MAKVAKRDSAKTRKWSANVTQNCDALDLKGQVFKLNDPEKIARSLKKSATKSRRKKGTPFQSAMSMLNFYINRAGSNLPDSQRNVLEKAKNELRLLFGKEEK